MLRIVVRLDRAGEVRESLPLGEIEIWNETQLGSRADYVAELKLPGAEPRRGKIKGFPRQEGAWALVRQALELFEDRLPRREPP